MNKEYEINKNIKISGSGTAGGGEYDQILISGSGKIQGDTECNIFKSSGSSKVLGNLIAKNCKVSGSAKFNGNVEVEQIKISGASKIEYNLTGKDIRISGSARIGGKLKGENVKISGSVAVGGDCEAEEFNARGGFNIGGLLNAENIEIQLGEKCTVKEVWGKNIKVCNSLDVGIKLFGIFVRRHGKLYTDVIEGDDIDIENTNAKIVRGKNVKIGEDCCIETVEYEESINVHEEAKVNNQIQISNV